MTLEMWLRVDILGRRAARRHRRRQPIQHLHLPRRDRCFPVSTAIDGGEFVSLRTGTLTSGEWAHLACTYDGTTLIMYKDGIETGRRAGSGPIRDSGTAGTGLAKNNLGRRTDPRSTSSDHGVARTERDLRRRGLIAGG
jgi:hypothetical protein